MIGTNTVLLVGDRVRVVKSLGILGLRGEIGTITRGYDCVYYTFTPDAYPSRETGGFHSDSFEILREERAK
jgi:hypothetical protein